MRSARSRSRSRSRSLALWIVIPDRFYYLAGFYPVLIAAGAIVAEEVADGARGFFREHGRTAECFGGRDDGRSGIIAVSGLVFLPARASGASPAALADVPLQNINYNLGEEVGWHDLVREVAAVDRSLPPAERRSAVIVTSNYGEAGAIDRFGSASSCRTCTAGTTRTRGGDRRRRSSARRSRSGSTATS